MRVDVHHHWMPEAHYRNLERYVGPGESVRRAPDRAYVFREDVQFFMPTETYFQVEEQLRAMDAAGSDVAVLHVGLWQDWNTLDLCRELNDAAAAVQRAHPDRFLALAHVPQEGSAEAIAEVRRAVRELGLRGVGMNTHFRGRPLDDRALWPLFEAIDELGVPVVVHPASAPVEYAMLREYGLTVGLGRALELTTMTVRLLYSGLLRRYRNLRFVMSHLGGAFFALRNRVDPDLFARTLPAPGTLEHVRDVAFDEEQMSRIFFDTAPAVWGAPEVLCALELLGPEQIVLGSDYPVQKPFMERAVDIVDSLPVPEATRRKIYGENAARLFRL